MDNLIASYDSQCISSGERTMTGQLGLINRRPTVREQVKMQIEELQERIDELNKLMESLDKATELETVLDLMRKLGL